MEKLGWKILLVEDSEDDFILTRSYLSDVKTGQFQLTWAKDIDEGLRALAEKPLDLILVDYNLPGDSGLEFVLAARQQGCRIPVILLTGMATYDLDVEAMKAGVSDFLEKSQVNGPLLERAIRYAMERQQAQTRLELLNMELERAKASLEQRVIERTIELQASQERLSALVNRLEAQAELSRLFDEARLDARVVVDILARRTAELIGDACVVTRISEDGQLVMPVAFHHADPQAEAVLSSVLFGSSYPVGEGYAGQVAKTGEAVLVPEVTQRRKKFRDEHGAFIERYGVHSLLIVPLKVQDRVIGTLGITRDRPGNPYTPEDQVFLKGLASRAALAIGNAALYETAQKELSERQRIEAELSEIQTRLLDGVESERLALARELHDGPIQDLYGMTFQLSMLGELLEGENREMVTALVESVQHIVDNLRATSVELRPPALAKFGLVPTIRSHCDAFLKMQPGLQVQLNLMPDRADESAPVLSERARLALFRIYQVAMTNIARHARATQASVHLRYDNQYVIMEIEDNGVGFRVRRWLELARQGHLGLVGAKERAEALGGTFEVNSIPGKGTTVRVQLPRDA